MNKIEIIYKSIDNICDALNLNLPTFTDITDLTLDETIEMSQKLLKLIRTNHPRSVDSILISAFLLHGLLEDLARQVNEAVEKEILQ